MLSILSIKFVLTTTLTTLLRKKKCYSALNNCAENCGKYKLLSDSARHKDFHLLAQAEWTDTVSSPALQTLREREYYTEAEIPETADLIKLNAYTNMNIKEQVKCLHENASKENWFALSKSVYTAATVFNHRRGGEVAEMTTECFKNRSQGKVNGEIENSLSTLEKKLLRRYF